MMVVGLFLFGWLSYPHLHWVLPMLSSGLIGWSVIFIFLSSFNYLIDTYLWSAATALAANTVRLTSSFEFFPI